MKIKIRNQWIIYPKFGLGSVPYILDLSNEDINDDEIALCVEEQIYGDEK